MRISFDISAVSRKVVLPRTQPDWRSFWSAAVLRRSPARLLEIPAWIFLLLIVCAQILSAHANNPNQVDGMALVPSGACTPLFRAESDPKEIPVESFLLDVLPVTNTDFLEFVRANPKWRRSEVKRLFADRDYLKLWSSDLDPGPQTNAPVVFVSWFAAKAYAQWKGKRLPTTAEWEYAAAASPRRPDGENDPAFMNRLRHWYATPSPATLPPVGNQPPNFHGLRDLHGLIWEWVSDFNTAMVTGDARGDTGLDRQLFCGSGSEGSKDRNNFPAYMRYGFRSSLKASYTVHNLGFRCAKSINENQLLN